MEMFFLMSKPLVFKGWTGPKVAGSLAVCVLVAFLVVIVPGPAPAWNGKSATVLSGRSLVVSQGDGTQVRVDLYGVGAPDRDRTPELWKASRDRLARFVQGTRLTIEDVRSFKDGIRQSLVYLEGDGECVNEEMIRSGHGWVDPMHCRLVDCGHWYALEQQARSRKLGLWSRPESRTRALDFSGIPDQGSLSGCPECQLK